MINALSDEEWLTCCRAAKLGPVAREAIPALLETHRRNNRFESNQDSLIRSAAGDALFHISVETATEAMFEDIEHPNSEVRSSSCSLLAKHRLPANIAVPALLNAIDDEDWMVRRSAVYSVGMIRSSPETVVPKLTQCLATDSHPQVRDWAAMALGKYEDEASSAIPILLNGLHDDSEHVRSSCVRAIAKVDRSKLIQALHNEDKHVRQLAAHYLTYDVPD